jgi:hypothetical protein
VVGFFPFLWVDSDKMTQGLHKKGIKRKNCQQQGWEVPYKSCTAIFLLHTPARGSGGNYISEPMQAWLFA